MRNAANASLLPLERRRRDAGLIWRYIAADSVDAADRMIDRLTDTFELLVTSPQLGARIVIGSKQFRHSIVTPYVVIYRAAGDEIEIVRILHSARRWEDLL